MKSRPQIAQCWLSGSTQLCWGRSWGVIPASFELCSEIKGVELVLVQDNYPQGWGLHTADFLPMQLLAWKGFIRIKFFCASIASSPLWLEVSKLCGLLKGFSLGVALGVRAEGGSERVSAQIEKKWRKRSFQHRYVTSAKSLLQQLPRAGSSLWLSCVACWSTRVWFVLGHVTH